MILKFRISFCGLSNPWAAERKQVGMINTVKGALEASSIAFAATNLYPKEGFCLSHACEISAICILLT